MGDAENGAAANPKFTKCAIFLIVAFSTSVDYIQTVLSVALALISHSLQNVYQPKFGAKISVTFSSAVMAAHWLLSSAKRGGDYNDWPEIITDVVVLP